MIELKVRVGEPVNAGRLTLVPLLQTSDSFDGGYLPGPVAEDQNLITVTERAEGASVPELDVIVTGHLPVLLIEGEMLIGQLQNRVLNVSVLVAASERTPIPVSCVEAGRWGNRRTTGRGQRHAPTKLRAIKTKGVNLNLRTSRMAHSEQGRVWGEVAEYKQLVAASRPAFDEDFAESEALEDVVDAIGDELNVVVAGIEPVIDQIGVVTMIDGEVRGMELFDRARTLASYWPSLVQGFAVDAVLEETTDRGGAFEAHELVASVERFLARVADARIEQLPGVGLGETITIDGEGLVGTGLRWNGGSLHLAVFATCE